MTLFNRNDKSGDAAARPQAPTPQPNAAENGERRAKARRSRADLGRRHRQTILDLNVNTHQSRSIHGIGHQQGPQDHRRT